MMLSRSIFILMLFVICCFKAVSAQDKPAGATYYEEDVAASNPLRTEQTKELDDYIIAMKRDNSRLQELFQPDYSSAKAFEKSAERLLKTVCERIGYLTCASVPGVQQI